MELYKLAAIILAEQSPLDFNILTLHFLSP